MQREEPAGEVFGDRLELATRYAALLCTTGVERGLIGPREVDRIWHRHLLNCVVVQELLEPGLRVVDVGSGAGLPGLAIAIARPDLRITLVEPLLRRSTFLAEAVAELDIDVAIHRGRAEDATTLAVAGGADVVVSRAVAPLGRLMGWCLPLVRVDGRVLAMKGRSAENEIDRDHREIGRLGGADLQVRECGAAMLDSPTRVVQVRRARGAGRRR